MDARILAWNLVLRFLLELAALAGFGYAAWTLAGGGAIGGLAAGGAVVVAAALWGVFAVPGDPSRSGNAPVAVPGLVRFVLELAIIGGGDAGFAIAGAPLVAAVLGGLYVVHLVGSLGRTRWLLAQR